MIAGETEYIIHGGEDNYDYFLKNLFKKDPNKQKPKRTAEEKAARKEQRQQWWGKQKENFQNAGGVEGITSTLGNIVGFFKDDTPSDYDISMGGGQPAPQPEKKGISKEVMIIGGIAVLVIAAYGFSVMQKNKKVQIQSA